jgi:hypothetical protein
MANQSRLYLVPLVLVVSLGGLSLWLHLHQPRYAPVPGLGGCLEVRIPSPDSIHIPAPYAKLQSCPHISETIFRLELSEPQLAYPAWILSATGPENPYAWDKLLHVRWRALDTLEVGYTDAVHIEDRSDSAGAVQIVYVPEPGERPWWQW